ncbi:MAG: anti-sigma factor domain-containing protein [Gaiellaceae bacterium]
MTIAHDHELVAAYVLYALRPDEREAVERHLETCAECRAEAEELTGAASALALLADPVEPPAALRSGLLERAREERPQAPVVPLRRFALPAAGTLAAVAACAAVAFGVWALSLRGSLQDERSARGAEADAAAVLADPRARHVQLSGAPGILAVRRDGTAALAVNGLAPAPSGRTYQAWVIPPAHLGGKGDGPRSAGLFASRPDRPTLVSLSLPVRPTATVAVTVEAAGGAPQPTGSPVFQASPVSGLTLP